MAKLIMSTYEKAVKISEALFSGNVKSLSKEEILMCFKNVPSFSVKEGSLLIDMLIDNNIDCMMSNAENLLSMVEVCLSSNSDISAVLNKNSPLI